MLDVESRPGLAKFLESAIDGFKRIIEMMRLAAFVE
jgi:hypothetical protein